MQRKPSLLKKLSCTLLLGSAFLLSSTTWAETITDIAGRQVELPEKVDRILLGEGRLFNAVSLLEGQAPVARIAAWQGDFKKLDPQTYAVYQAKFPEIDSIPLIGGTSADSISAEKVLTVNPDIAIFGIAGHGPGKNSELVNQLQKSGVPVVFVDFRSNPLQNTIPSMRILGKALKREDVAERYIAFYEENMKRVTDITTKISEDKKPTVFIELRAASSEACCGTAGNGNMGDFIDLAGGLNIAKPLLPGVLGTVNLEKVIVADPQIYIASGAKAADADTLGIALGAQTTPEQVKASAIPVLARKGINTLTAVKEGRSYAIWHHFYNSPQNVLVVQSFAKWFYPEQFKDLDPVATQKEMYETFLAIEPTGTYWLPLGK